MEHYDCVIMGAGFAGNCVARHLLLNIPGIRIALVDPRSYPRTDRDLKVGESSIEVAGLFLTQELRLQNYMIENHSPKYGLNFHWPKDVERTATREDYLSIFCTGAPHTAVTFHFNRARLETDLLRMNQEMGAVFIQGHVDDFDLGPDETDHSIHVRTGDTKKTLTCRYLVDCAGRKFLIGRKVDNMVEDADSLYGVQNASAWIRVRNADPSLIDDGVHPDRIVSPLYATNHWFGHGHWVWTIPSSPGGELSFGVVFHKDKIPVDRLNRREKFLAFLEANHNLVYKTIQTGEIVDFNWRPQLAYRCKQYLSKDRWYCVGDAGHIIDAFYSLGTSTLAMTAEHITEIIRADRAGEPDVEEKRRLYNEFDVLASETVNLIISGGSETLGNASVMSFRIFLDNMYYFYGMLPTYVSKRHMDKAFLRFALPGMRYFAKTWYRSMRDELMELARDERHVGFVNPYLKGELGGPWSAYSMVRDASENYINAEVAPGLLNVFAHSRRLMFRGAQWYAKLVHNAYGVGAWTRPRTYRNALPLVVLGATAVAGELGFEVQKVLRRGSRDDFYAKRARAVDGYVPRRTLVEWGAAPIHGNLPHSDSELSPPA